MQRHRWEASVISRQRGAAAINIIKLEKTTFKCDVEYRSCCLLHDQIRPRGYLINAHVIIYMQLMRYPHVFSEFSLQMTSIKSITHTVFNIMEHGNEENVNNVKEKLFVIETKNITIMIILMTITVPGSNYTFDSLKDDTTSTSTVLIW